MDIRRMLVYLCNYFNPNLTNFEMLPKTDFENYQEFLSLLLKMQQNLKSTEQDNLKQIYQELQQKFTEKIIILTGNELEGPNYQKWQSLQTEIHRSFKLLETQIMFLLTSRQSTTNHKHLNTINNYLTKLILYCENIIK